MSDGGVVFQRDDFHISPGSVESKGPTIDEAGRPYLQASMGAVMDPAGKWIVAHSNYPGPTVTHSKLLAMDATTGDSLSEMLSFDAPMNQAVVTTDGKFWVGGFGRVYWDYRGCRVEIRSLPEMNLVRTIPFEDTIRAVCVSDDNKRIVVGGGRAGRPGFAQVFDFESGKALTPPVDAPKLRAKICVCWRATVTSSPRAVMAHCDSGTFETGRKLRRHPPWTPGESIGGGSSRAVAGHWYCNE